jgi:hypothetical protein
MAGIFDFRLARRGGLVAIGRNCHTTFSTRIPKLDFDFALLIEV